MRKEQNEISTRRKFLKNGSIITMGLMAGSTPNLESSSPSTVFPFQENLALNVLPDKHPELKILNDRPINAEAPAHILEEAITSSDRFFVRNNGIPPEKAIISKAQWVLSIEGESAKQSKSYTLQDLQNQFPHYTYQLTLECGGNGRKEFNPPAKGNQWSIGAVACSNWTGVRLKDVLKDVGIKADAKYIGYYGADTHLSGDNTKVPISRGVPIQKAMEEESLIAWALNGEDIPILNGYPLRLVFGGWPASCSGKWLNKIVIRNKKHDGAKMKAPSYSVPCTPVAPGAKVQIEDMCTIESMPVKSLITFPKTGGIIQFGQPFLISGHAWAGDLAVKEMYYSIDFGSSWEQCELTSPVNRFAWQHFKANLSFPHRGYYEVWAKAVDEQGKSQPMILPGWNPKGYLNNACHRIAIKVT